MILIKDICQMFVDADLVKSKTECRSLIRCGALKVAGERLEQEWEVVTDDEFNNGFILQRGKRQFKKAICKK